MNTVITALGWLGWFTMLSFAVGGAWCVWVWMGERKLPQGPDTDPNLPTCRVCGWVQGVNDYCEQCQHDRKVQP